MKLVRARPKLPEHMPDWVKCCTELPTVIAAWPEVVLDLSEVHSTTISCSLCQRTINTSHVVAKVNSGPREFLGNWYPLEVVDLDEGPVAA